MEKSGSFMEIWNGVDDMLSTLNPPYRFPFEFTRYETR